MSKLAHSHQPTMDEIEERAMNERPEPTPPEGDGYSDSTPHLLMCAQINFENLERVIPHFTRHPFYRIAKAQLDAVVRRLNAETP